VQFGVESASDHFGKGAELVFVAFFGNQASDGEDAERNMKAGPFHIIGERIESPPDED
jgi:hypothetical protein